MKAQLETLIKNSKKPIVIFDLDGTLFDVTYRTIEILRRFVSRKEIQERFPEQVQIVQNLKHKDFHYSLEKTLQEAGIERYSEISAEFLQLAISNWYKNFFRDEILQFDRTYPGACECVQWFHDKKVHVAYVSGRDIPNMSRGTLEALEHEKLPHTGTLVSIYLKPSYGQDDLTFKRHCIEAIKDTGQVIATFDNEPANVELFIRTFPNAMNFHLENLFARHLSLSGANFFAIQSFAELGFRFKGVVQTE